MHQIKLAHMPWGRRREALPPGTESLGMDAQLRGHFRGRFAAVEPQLNGLAFEGFIELLSGLLGLDHRFTHTRLMALCLFYLCPSNRRSPRNSIPDDEVASAERKRRIDN